MIKIFKNLYEARRLASENRVAEQQAISRLLSETQGLVTEKPDAGGFVRIHAIGDSEKGHLESNQFEMIRQARKMYRWNENARAAITTLVNYVMGRGVTITPKAQNPMLWYVWREFWTASRNDMRLKQFQICTRLFRDGEVFLEFFDTDENGKSTGKTSVRFIDPLLVKNPAAISNQRGNFDVNNTRSGIETDPEDVERVLRYWVQLRGKEYEFRAVPADKVIHIKVFADSDQRRGESLLQPIMRLITHHEGWLENRILLNKMRTAIVLIQKIEGTPAQVAAMQSKFPSANTPTGTTKRQNIRGGTMLVAGPGVDYKMESPNINATDAKEDGRHIKTGMAAGLNMPEYVFGDASNANFSSSMVAESPMVKAVQYWQVFLEFYWGEIYRKVVANAVAAGLAKEPDDREFMLKLKSEAQLVEQDEDDERGDDKNAPDESLLAKGHLEIPREVFYGCDMQWPEIVHRDMKMHTDSLVVARSAGWVSDPTASAALGFDYAEEVRKQKMAEEEAAAAGNPLMNAKAGTGDEFSMANELGDLFSGMSPIEKQAILQQRNPADVANLMLSRTGGNGNADNQTG